MLTRRRRVTPEVPLPSESLTDAEIARLLALLAASVEVVPVAHGDAVTREDEPCPSGC